MWRRKGKAKPSSPPAAASSAAEVAVLGDDDLLREILVRLEHPTCLVHAALVSRRWLRHASDPAFLRRFRRLHPPRLLGLYVEGSLGALGLRFVPLPHPRELDVVFNRASFEVGATKIGFLVDCRDGRFLALLHKETALGFGVWSPLQPAPGSPVLALPPPMAPNDLGPNADLDLYGSLPEGCGDSLSWIVVIVVRNGPKIFAQQFVFQDGAWGEVRTSASIEAPPPASSVSCRKCSLLVNRKFYMLGKVGYIIGLDLAPMSLFVIKLPDGVQQPKHMEKLLLPADDSGFYLIHLKGFQIHVWLHRTDGDRAGEWRLVDTICIRQAIGDIVKPNWESKVLTMHRVGDNAELLLKVGREVLYIHIRSRKVEKVFQQAPEDNQDLWSIPSRWFGLPPFQN